MKHYFLRPLRHGMRAVAIMFCVIYVNTINAAGTDNEKPILSLHTAVLKTLQLNPDLQAQALSITAQQGLIEQAQLSPSPVISVEVEDFFGSDKFKGIDQAQATVSIAWILERGTRQQYVNVARAGASLINVESDIKRLDAAAETGRRYINSLAYQARMINAVKAVQLAEETIKDVKKRVNAGQTPAAELAKARVELARQRLEQEDIEHELDSAIRLLAAQWGELSPEFSKVAGYITNLPILASFESLKEKLTENPEFTRLVSDQRMKQAELALQLAKRKSDWRFNAGIRHMESTNDQALVAGISIPFGKSTRNAGRIAEARANLEKTSLEERAVRVRIETTLFVLYEKLQHSQHRINTLSQDIIPPLKQVLKDSRRAYKLGRYSYLEWRSAQSELLSAQTLLIEASVDAQRQIIEIERLTGVSVAQSNTRP